MEFVGAVLAILLTLIELPPILIRFGRKALDWWSLLSHRRTVKRLAKLESDLIKLEQMPQIEEHQAEFYNCVLIILSAAAAGLMSATFHFYRLETNHPDPFLALAVICFTSAALAGIWGLNHFQYFMRSTRIARKVAIEAGIQAMKEKLAEDSRRL